MLPNESNDMIMFNSLDDIALGCILKLAERVCTWIYVIRSWLTPVECACIRMFMDTADNSCPTEDALLLL